MSKPARVIVLAPVDYTTGYGIDACLKICGLVQRRHNVFVRASNFKDSKEGPVPYAVQERLIHAPTENEWELLIQPPWFCPTPGKKTVICTTIETTATKKEYISNLNKCEAVIVPSHWNRECLMKAGVTKPVYWCPETVDPVFKPWDSAWTKRAIRKTKFVFGTGGNTRQNGGTRKNIKTVVQAFLNAFPDNPNVRLRIKSDGPIPGTQDPRIEVWTQPLSPREMFDWYHDLDAFVSASRGEAWGRMVHEAMACARAVITTEFGGHRETFSEIGGFPVAFQVVDASGEYAGLGKWCEPSLEDLGNKMHTAYNTPREALMEIGKQGFKSILDYSIDGCGAILEEILIAVGMIPEPPEPPKCLLTTYTPEERIMNFYREIEEIPKLPVPEEIKSKNLTNTPQGVGDTMILTPFHSKFGNRKIFSKSDSFASLMYFNPYYDAWVPNNLVCVDQMQKRYSMGGGHFIQRLARALGEEVPIKPKGFLEVNGFDRVKNRVAVHLLPGGHSEWQKRYIHPRAREMYDRSVKLLQYFVRKNGQYQWYEIGSRRSNWLDESRDVTGVGLCETIRFLKTCEFFLGIVSGPMHIATALDCKCIVIVNFPPAELIYLPTLKDIPQVEAEWLYPTAVHLHQEDDGPLVKKFSYDNLLRAFNGEIYPFWSDKYLPLINEKL